tara:strand:- start:364 stop:525 length:162 start_codon:yes stop_codon:yes gene_type:complete
MMTNAEEKLAKIELMFATSNAYDNPRHKLYSPVVPVSGSQRLDIIQEIMKGKA